MIQLTVIEGPQRAAVVASDGESWVVGRHEANVLTEHERAGGWVLRPIAGGPAVRLNGEPATGREALQLGDRIEADGSVYLVRAIDPPRREAAPIAHADDAKQFVLRFRDEPEPAASGEDDAVVLPVAQPLPEASPWRRLRYAGPLLGPSVWRPAGIAAAMLVGLALFALLRVSPADPIAGWADADAEPAAGATRHDTPEPKPAAELVDADRADEPSAGDTPTPRDDRATGARSAPPTADADGPRADARGVLYLLDASSTMGHRLPAAVDHLRERVAALPPSRRFLIALVNGEGLTFIPADGFGPATHAARAESLTFLDPSADRLVPTGDGDRIDAIAFAIAHADPGDELVLITAEPTGPTHGDAEALYHRVADLMAGCDLRLSVVQLHDRAPAPALRRLADDFGGDHTPVLVPRVAGVLP